MLTTTDIPKLTKPGMKVLKKGRKKKNKKYANKKKN